MNQLNEYELDLAKQTLKESIDQVFDIIKIIQGVTESPEGKEIIRSFIKQMVEILGEILKQSIPELVDALKNAIKLIPIAGDILAAADLIDGLIKIIIQFGKTALDSSLIGLETYNKLIDISDKMQQSMDTIRNMDKTAIQKSTHLIDSGIDTSINYGLNKMITGGGNIRFQKGGLKRVHNSIHTFLNSGITSKKVIKLYKRANRKSKRKGRVNK